MSTEKYDVLEPNIYPVTSYDITSGDIDSDALFVIRRLQDAGHTAYLVGGGVRDLLFHNRPKDFDISTSARPEEIRRLFRNCLLIGRRFRLAHVRFGKKVIEVSTFRAGDPETDTLITMDNEWGTPEEDVLRRDFTINGLYLDPTEGVIIDYVGGVADIQRRRLITIGVPEVRFRQDPVRMIRLLKFRARFDLEIEPSTEQALWACATEIRKSAPARVLEELLRMLESGASHQFFRMLVDFGLLEQIMPELATAFRGEEGVEMFRALRALDAFHSRGKLTFSRTTLMAALIWPLFYSLVSAHAEHSEKEPHLEQYAEMADHLVGHLLRHFTHFPKKLRTQIVICLANQSRLTPFGDKKLTYKWRAHGPDRQDALNLLKIRAALHSPLLPIYENWRRLPSPARSH